MPLTVFGVAMAMERNPAAVEAFLRDGHEIASHGWRWISYQDVDESTEREHMTRAVDAIRRLTGTAARGLVHRAATARTRAGWSSSTAASSTTPTPTPTTCPTGSRSTRPRGATPHLVVPVHARRQRHALRHAAGLQQRRPVLAYLKDASTCFTPKATPPDSTRRRCCRSACTAASSAGPARAGVARALPRLRARHDDVWFARRIDIARHWIAHASVRAKRMTLARDQRARPGAFVAALGGVFEHSPWVAQRACDARPFASVDALHAAMVAAVERASTRDEQLALIRAHPELAGQGGGPRRR